MPDVLTIIAAAAAGDNEFSTGGGSDQVWMDVFASALSGIVLFPPAFLFVWAFYRLTLDRWFGVSAALATVFSVLVTSAVDALVMPIYYYLELGLKLAGIGRHMYLASPGLVVCFVGSIGLAWWLKRKRRLHASNLIEEAFE